MGRREEEDGGEALAVSSTGGERTAPTCVVWVSRVSQCQQNTPEGCGSWSQPGWVGGGQLGSGQVWDLIRVELWLLGPELTPLPPSV